MTALASVLPRFVHAVELVNEAGAELVVAEWKLRTTREGKATLVVTVRPSLSGSSHTPRHDSNCDSGPSADGVSGDRGGLSAPHGKTRSTSLTRDAALEPETIGDGAADGTKGERIGELTVDEAVALARYALDGLAVAPVPRRRASSPATRLRVLSALLREVRVELNGDVGRWAEDVAAELDEVAVAADELAAVTARVAAQGVRP